jgi:hypothetical protein
MGQSFSIPSRLLLEQVLELRHQSMTLSEVAAPPSRCKGFVPLSYPCCQCAPAAVNTTPHPTRNIPISIHIPYLIQKPQLPLTLTVHPCPISSFILRTGEHRYQDTSDPLYEVISRFLPARHPDHPSPLLALQRVSLIRHFYCRELSSFTVSKLPSLITAAPISASDKSTNTPTPILPSLASLRLAFKVSKRQTEAFRYIAPHRLGSV